MKKFSRWLEERDKFADRVANFQKRDRREKWSEIAHGAAKGIGTGLGLAGGVYPFQHFAHTAGLATTASFGAASAIYGGVAGALHANAIRKNRAKQARSAGLIGVDKALGTNMVKVKPNN